MCCCVRRSMSTINVSAASERRESVDDADIPDLDDDQIDQVLEAFAAQASDHDVNELLQTMNRHSMITWEEAEHYLGGGLSPVVKSGLPEHRRPTEPENLTDVDQCIQRLHDNDPGMLEVNLNNMKRVPLVQIQKLLGQLSRNTHLKKLSLSNTGITDSAAEPLLEVLDRNTTLISINLETNYLSGEFLARLFRALLKNQTVEEVRASNQGVTFSSTAEMEMMEAIIENETLLKVGITFRKHEARLKVDQCLLRNNEIKRLLRLEDAKLDTARKVRLASEAYDFD